MLPIIIIIPLYIGFRNIFAIIGLRTIKRGKGITQPINFGTNELPFTCTYYIPAGADIVGLVFVLQQLWAILRELL